MEDYCDNYRSGDELDSLYIAYAKKNYPLFVVIPIIAIIINIFTLVILFKKLQKSERKQYIKL